MSLSAHRSPGLTGAHLPQPAVGGVPSGQSVELFEVLLDEVEAEAWVRFRFLAPDVSRDDGVLSFEQAEADFEYLCSAIALPYLVEHNLRADVVVVTLLDRPVQFGSSDPDATQLIEAFRVAGGRCEWEGLW